jgi:hypothetical protein
LNDERDRSLVYFVHLDLSETRAFGARVRNARGEKTTATRAEVNEISIMLLLLLL